MSARIAAIGLALAARAAAATPLCEAQVELDPPRAYVGQQVVHRLRILRNAAESSARFSEAPAFPSFRVEWLPAETLERDTAANRLVVEERRALFPVRPGVLAIPPARVECRTPDGSAFATLAATQLEVLDAPEAGRPADYAGLVGRVGISAALERAALALGESVVLTIALRGEANLWDAPAPLAAPIEGLDVHPRESALERSTGDRLALTRTFAYDLVPHRGGAHVVPALRVAWLDPATGRYEIAESAALRLDVADVTPSGEARHAETPVRAAPRRLPLGTLGATALLLGLLAAWLRARRAPRGATPRAAAEPHLARAAGAGGDRAAELAALAAALRAALEARAPEARSLSAEELVARSEGARREAAEALLALDRARFGAGSTSAPGSDRVRDLVRSLDAEPD